MVVIGVGVVAAEEKRLKKENGDIVVLFDEGESVYKCVSLVCVCV